MTGQTGPVTDGLVNPEQREGEGEGAPTDGRKVGGRTQGEDEPKKVTLTLFLVVEIEKRRDRDRGFRLP